jgi:hypothetical protein
MVKYKYIILSLSVLLLGGCQKWLDVNEDPNNPSEIDYEMVLPSGITSVVYVMGGKFQILGALWSEHWTQSPGASQYAGIDAYDINSSNFDDRQWGELYAGCLEATEYVRNEAAKEGSWNYYLAATVIQAYTFQILVDLYDKIPFSQALQGEDLLLEPVYENGQDIYDSLIARIDYALSKDIEDEDLKEFTADQDIIFNGDIDNWVRFANSLKLKIYLRQSEARPDVAAAGIQAMYDEEVDFLNTDAAFIYFSDESGRRNPLYETEEVVLGGNPNLILSKTLHTYLQENNDFDRLDNMFYTPDNGGPHKSLVQGNYNDPEEPAGTNSASYSKPVFLPTFPVYLMSLTESDFLQAEAMMRYGVGTYKEAKDLYDEGFTDAYVRVVSIGSTSMSQILRDAEAYLQSGEYAFPSEGSPLEKYIETIAMQKWVSLAGIQSLETFFEHNRTGYPKVSNVLSDDDNYEPGELTISVNNVTSGRLPKRLIWPESEYQGNRNTPEKKEVWEKVWWDVKPDTE